MHRLGAAIVVETREVLSVFDRHFHNPLCFLQYYNSSKPLSEVNNDKVCLPIYLNCVYVFIIYLKISMIFIGNNAIVGSAIYINELDFCSWSSFYYPFFYNTSSVLRWPFISYM